MNITETISFDPDKPAILSIRKTGTVNLFAVGLLKSQVLKKHKAVIPSLLTVLKGAIAFRMKDETISLKQYDTYDIPVNVEHEVAGVDEENIFTVLQEK